MTNLVVVVVVFVLVIFSVSAVREDYLFFAILIEAAAVALLFYCFAAFLTFVVLAVAPLLTGGVGIVSYLVIIYYSASSVYYAPFV